MQGGGSIVEVARMAAALATTEWPARVAARRPVWNRNYCGVQHRKNRYSSVIRNIHTRRLVWLGSYRTPEEAAYAWDAAARLTRGHWTKTNFPEPDWARAAPAREVVSTELVLAQPTPAAAPKRRDPAEAVAAQVSFDNWLLSSSATTALRSTEPVVHASQFLPAAVPTQHRDLPVSQTGVFDLAIVWDTSPTTVRPRPRLPHLLQCLGSLPRICCSKSVCLVAAARVGHSKQETEAAPGAEGLPAIDCDYLMRFPRVLDI